MSNLQQSQPNSTPNNVTCHAGRDDDGDMSLSINPTIGPEVAFFAKHPLYRHWLSVLVAMRRDAQAPRNTIEVERRHDVGQARLKLSYSASTSTQPSSIRVEILNPDDPDWPTVKFANSDSHSERTRRALRRLYDHVRQH